MAVTFTVTNRKVFVIGDRKMLIAKVACTGTPTAGGDALTGSTLGLGTESNVVFVGNAANAGATSALVAQWDDTDDKIAFYVQGTAGAGNALVAYTGDTANHTIQVIAIGKGTVTA